MRRAADAEGIAFSSIFVRSVSDRDSLIPPNGRGGQRELRQAFTPTQIAQIAIATAALTPRAMSVGSSI